MKAKKTENLLKKIIVGCVWAFVYICLIVPVISYLINFDLLSTADWQERINAFFEYQWIISTLSDFMLLLCMILIVPMFFVGWYFLNKIKWTLFRTKHKANVYVPEVLKHQDGKQTYAMPRALPSIMTANKYVAPQLPGQEKMAPEKGAKSHTNVMQMIKSVAILAKKYQVEVFQHITLDGYHIPLAISTDSRAIMIEIVNQKGVNWSVEYTDDVREGNWHSESGVMDKLARELIMSSAALAKAEPNSEILSAILLTEGNLLNAKQTVDYFKKYGIFVLSYNNGEPKSDLLDLPSFLSAYFDLKNGEENPATQILDKVAIGQAMKPDHDKINNPQPVEQKDENA